MPRVFEEAVEGEILPTGLDWLGEDCIPLLMDEAPFCSARALGWWKVDVASEADKAETVGVTGTVDDVRA